MKQPQKGRRHLGGSFVPKTTGETPALLRRADQGSQSFELTPHRNLRIVDPLDLR